jgi:hypothetical protein
VSTVGRWVIGAGLPLVALLGTSSLAQTERIPAIDKGLPWSFIGTPEASDRPYNIRGVKATAAWSWKSAKPYARDRAGRWYLWFALARFDFPDAKAASAALDTVIPSEIETGIWEYFARDGAHLWHLAAPCRWSQKNFDKLVDNVIAETMAGVKPPAGSVVTCACGGFWKKL